MKTTRKKHPDLNQLAASIVAEATDEEKPKETPSNKNPHAVAREKTRYSTHKIAQYADIVVLTKSRK